MEKVYEIYIKTTPERLEGLELGAWAVAGLSFPSPLLEIGSRLDRRAGVPGAGERPAPELYDSYYSSPS